MIIAIFLAPLREDYKQYDNKGTIMKLVTAV